MKRRGGFLGRCLGDEGEEDRNSASGSPTQLGSSMDGRVSGGAGAVEDSDIWPAGRAVGESLVIRELRARSHASLVYRALDRSSQRDVAVKVLLGRWRKNADGRHRWVRFADDSRAMECLQAEVDTNTRRSHPHLARTYRLLCDATTGRLPAIVMEYAAGGSLADRLQLGQPLSVAEGLDVASQVCWALQYLHDKRGTHRNLKSQNVLFAPEDEVGTDRILVSDEVLGWACGARGWLPSEWPADAEESEVLATLLDNGGTPTHMAPEFWGTWPTTSPSFDVYAFGVLLYETLCRRLPFVDPGSLQALRRAHKEAPVPDPRRWNSEIPPVLGNLMQACMAKDPRERPGGVGPLAEQLGELYREVNGQDYRVARQRPATPELDLELRKHRAGQMVVRGISAQHGGDFDAACSLLEEAAAMLRELDDPAALQHCLNRHAQVLCECGRLDEAWALLEEQESLCHQLRDGGALSMCLGLRAAVLKEQGELEAALAVLAEQEATCRGLEDLGNLSSCLFNQGGILAKLDHREEALQKIEDSENLSRQLEDFDALRQSLHYHALLLQAWDRPKGALPILKEEEAVCRQLGDPDALSACREAQASVLDDLDRG